MARRGRSGAGSRPRARADSAVVPFPRVRPVDRLDLARVVPSGRSMLVGLLLFALGALGYAAARTTSLFAVERIAVANATAELAADVREASATAQGKSLLSLDLDRLSTRLEALPSVAAVTFDREFPNTLSIAVMPERPVAVLRQGAKSWLTSARGRVIGTIARGTRPALPRVWLGRGVSVVVGGFVGGDTGAAVRALAPLADSSLPIRVASARAAGGDLTLKLRSGPEVRLGDGADLPLKLAVAARILPRLDAEITYLDVSIPRWPVAGSSLDSKVEVETQPSSTP